MKNRIDKIIQLIDYISSRGANHLSKFHNTSFNDLEKTLAILILERIVGNLSSSRILLSGLINNRKVEPAIGLILRNNLSLCKIVFKHSEIKNNQSSELKQFYKTIFGENIQKTIKHIKKCPHKKKELQSSIENIKNSYPFILMETGIDLDEIEKESFEPIKFPNGFESLENLFIAFSKYEHFGLNTLILQDNKEVDILERIEIAVHYSLQGIITRLLMLQIVDNELIDKNRELAYIAKTLNK